MHGFRSNEVGCESDVRGSKRKNVKNLKIVRREAGRHLTRRKEYLKAKIDALETKSKIENRLV